MIICFGFLVCNLCEGVMFMPGIEARCAPLTVLVAGMLKHSSVRDERA